VTNALLLLRKLSVLNEHVRRARRRRPDDLQRFLDDADMQDATAMSLLVAIQEAIDIALHVASDEGWGIPASYAAAFDLLAAHGVIDAALARALGAAAALRNRIAHGYATLDAARLHAEIPAGLAALEQLAATIAAFLAKPPT
jgi:uncharacterized protein YutE (UPF0331/DUF86 family)